MRHGSDPWVGKIPLSRKWQLSPIFLPGKFHASLVGYSPGDHKEADMTEHAHNPIGPFIKFTLTLPDLWLFTSFEPGEQSRAWEDRVNHPESAPIVLSPSFPQAVFPTVVS